MSLILIAIIVPVNAHPSQSTQDQTFYEDLMNGHRDRALLLLHIGPNTS